MKWLSSKLDIKLKQYIQTCNQVSDWAVRLRFKKNLNFVIVKYMKRLRLIPYSDYSAAFNMAADEYILSRPGTTLRYYGWSHPTLSFGRNNKKLDEIDLDVCKANQIELVSRLTGGKTVLHQHEITYSICSDIDLFSSSILKTYRMISQPLAESLNRFGANTEISPKQLSKRETSICFQEVSAYEIAVGGKKIVGSAQYRKTDRFLQHGSILIDLNWDLWKKVWKVPLESKVLERRITTVNQESTEPFDQEQFEYQFAEQLAAVLGMEYYLEDFESEEINRITKLMKKYEWSGNGCRGKY